MPRVHLPRTIEAIERYHTRRILRLLISAHDVDVGMGGSYGDRLMHAMWQLLRDTLFFCDYLATRSQQNNVTGNDVFMAINDVRRK